MINLTGNIFGYLTVSQPSSKRSNSGEIIWRCNCSCGRTAYYSSTKLKAGKRISCGKCTPEERKEITVDQRTKAKAKLNKIHFSALPTKKQLYIINQYCFGSGIKELSDKYKVTPRTLRDGIISYRERLNTMYELNYMKSIEKLQLPVETIKKAIATDFISDTLRDMLSSDTAEVLTDHEIMYCYLFAHTGSNELALKESQLDKCLTKSTPIRLQYLGMFLREKPNLVLYIKALQEGRIAQIEADKQNIQDMLITQIEQMRESLATGSAPVNMRGNMLRAIELLGKTIPGTFEDKILIEDVNATSSLDRLLDMAKQGVVKQITDGSQSEETFEMESE